MGDEVTCAGSARISHASRDRLSVQGSMKQGQNNAGSVGQNPRGHHKQPGLSSHATLLRARTRAS